MLVDIEKPTKKIKQNWAEYLCTLLKQYGLKVSWRWESDLETVVVRYRIEDATWKFWSRFEDCWGKKPKKKIQTLWLISSTRFERRHGVMMPIMRWQCEETYQVFEGEEIFDYVTSRSIKA